MPVDWCSQAAALCYEEFDCDGDGAVDVVRIDSNGGRGAILSSANNCSESAWPNSAAIKCTDLLSMLLRSLENCIGGTALHDILVLYLPIPNQCLIGQTKKNQHVLSSAPKR